MEQRINLYCETYKHCLTDNNIDTYLSLLRNQKLLANPMSPLEYFKVAKGSISQRKGEVGYDTYSICLDIEPFIWGDEIVDTEIVLDFIKFNELTFEELSNKSFKFPLNPEEGYIDGSVYIESCHNPIFVTNINFGSRLLELLDDDKKVHNKNEDYIIATILFRFCWEGEDLEDYPESKRINVVLKLGS